MTTVTAKVREGEIDEINLSNSVLGVDIWRKETEGVGTFQVHIRDPARTYSSNIAPDDQISIYIEGKAALKGYVDLIRPISSQEKSHMQQECLLLGKDYGQDLLNKLNEKQYKKQPADDIVQDMLVSSGTEVTYTSNHTAPQIQFTDLPPQILLDALRKIAELINWKFFVGSNKALNFFSSIGTPIVLKAVAGAPDNNLLSLKRIQADINEARNYVIVRGGKVQDGWTDGNASDWTQEYTGGTVSDEYVIVKEGIGSIKFTRGTATEIIAKLAFPKYNYDYLDFSAYSSEDLAFWVYALSDYPAYDYPIYVELEDTNLNIIQMRGDGIPHGIWKKVVFPVGEGVEIGGDLWKYAQGSTFNWKVKTIWIYISSAINTMFIDGLNLPIRMIAVSQDAQSQSLYTVRKTKPIEAANIRTQVELQQFADSECEKLKDSMEVLHAVAVGSAGIISNIWYWTPGVGAKVNSPSDGINNVDYRMAEIHHVLRKNPTTQFDWVVELVLVPWNAKIKTLRKSFATSPKEAVQRALDERLTFLEKKEERLRDFPPSLPAPLKDTYISITALAQWLSKRQHQTDAVQLGIDSNIWYVYAQNGGVTSETIDGYPGVTVFVNGTLPANAYIQTNRTWTLDTDRENLFAAKVRKDFTTGCRIRIGLYDISSFAGCTFYCDENNNLYAVSRRGATEESVQISGVDVTQYHHYMIKMKPTEVKYYIDDELEAVITNQNAIPDSATPIPMHFLVWDVNGGATRRLLIKTAIAERVR